jgi:hypothetical protein
VEWTTLTGWILIGLAASSLVAALYCQYRAYDHLAGDAALARREVRRLGPFAKRDRFSEIGWWYWKRSFQLASLTVALMIIGGLLIAPSYR